MIELSRVITKGALMRDEFRGAHYKPEFDLKQPSKFDPHEYIDYLEKKNYGEVSEDSFPEGHLDYMKRFEANNNNWLKAVDSRHSPLGTWPAWPKEAHLTPKLTQHHAEGFDSD